MRRTLLNDGWTVRPKSNRFEERLGAGAPGTPVTLPHDALLESPRIPDGNPATAFYTGGEWEYTRDIDRSAETVFLEFEGIYRDGLVFVDDTVVAHRPSGYTGFVAQVDHLLRDSGATSVRVEARMQADSRWYPGAGLYRNVWLLEGGLTYLAPNGLEVRTPEVDDDMAIVSVSAEVVNRSSRPSAPTMRVEILDHAGEIVSRTEARTSVLPGGSPPIRHRLGVATPRRWGPDDPYLYSCRVSLRDGDHVLDEESTTFGIRTLSLDPVRGLRVNGRVVVLRGACIHHDNGVLGAATIDRAEERRAEVLKAAGFNAIRSAHNPLSIAMLDACDRLGILVMDEAFDMWEQPKSEHDYALRFAEWWEADVEAMVRKDINHPSVIMYSIGNEIPEAGRPHGSRVGRALAEKIRSLDGTRYLTEAVSGMLIGGPEIFDEIRSHIAERADQSGGEAGPNSAMTNLADLMNHAMLAPSIAKYSSETFSYLDVAGYNYMDSRYAIDGEQYPNRVIVGSETHPMAIDVGWAGVVAHPHVIGDFTWTGWDYLGEAGIGRTDYGVQGEAAAPSSFLGAYPWRTAWCGDVDITGHRRPQSYYREIVFGLRSDPYIAVIRPAHHGETGGTTPWSWSDSVSSWSWAGHEGSAVTVEVYAASEEVELLLNGRSLGRQPTGSKHRFRATFETIYDPGLLEAVAWDATGRVGQSRLRSAQGPVELAVEVDRSVIAANAQDLAFVSISLVDPSGVLQMGTDRVVTVALQGPAVLQGLGSANPATDEGFAGTHCVTFDGRALAVVRPTGSGAITVAVTADGCEPARVHVDAS
jgi:beta-galactosidase